MKFRIPLKGYLSLHFGIVAILPVVNIACMVWFFVMPAVKTCTGIQHQAMARSIAGQISAYLDGGTRQLTALAGYLHDQAFSPDARTVRLLDAQCGQGEFFEALFVVDRTSATIQAVGLSRPRRSHRVDYMGLDLSGRRFLNAGNNVRRAVWSNTFLSTVSSRRAVALTVPLERGFIIGEVALDKLSEFISLLPVESELRTLVIDGQGIVLGDSQKRRSGQVLDINRPETGQGASTGFTMDGVEMFGTVVAMDTAGWTVLVAQPARRAFEPLREMFSLIGLGLAIALALMLSASWLLAGKLSALFKSYAEIAESIADGRYALALPTARTREFARLGQSLKRMAETISQRETALVASEERLRDLLINVPGVVYQYKGDPEALEFSSLTSVVRERTVEIFGLDSEQGSFFSDFVACLPEKDQARFVSSVKEALETAAPWYYEGRFTKPSGETIWFEGRSVPRRVGDELVYYGVFADTTWRREMESSLRLAQFIVDNAPIVILRMGEDGKVLDVNQQGCASLGYTKEELCRMTIFDFDPAFDRDAWARNTTALNAAGTTTIESQHRRKNGEVFPIQVIQNRMRFEGQGFHVAFVQDITERKRAEAALREKDQLLHDIGKLVKIGGWRFDLGTGKPTTTDEVARICDFEPVQDVNAEKVLECFHGVYREKIEHAYNRLIEQGIPYDLELELISAKGICKWVRTIGYPVMQDGRIVQVQGSFQDITERKRTEAALQEKNQLLLDIGKLVKIGGWKFDPETGKVTTTAGVARICDVEPVQEMSIEKGFAFFQGVHREKIEHALNAALGKGTPYDLELELISAKGIRKWVRVIGNPVMQDGRVVHVQGSLQDITDRKRTEETLRKNEQLLSNILESMNEGLLVLDNDYRYTHFNSSMWNMVGVPKENVLGKVPWEAFPFLKDTVVEKNIRQTMAGESAGSFEFRFQITGEREVWNRDSFSPLKDADGRTIGVVGVVSDITKQKKDEIELRRLRNYLSNIIDSMPSILVAVDNDGRVTLWNHQTAQTTGVSFAAARSRPLQKVFPRLAGEMERVSTAMRERRVMSAPKVRRWSDHDLRYEDITIFPLVAEGVEGAVIRVDDVTQQVRMEEMMIQSEKMLSVGGLAAGMAHEINNPLAGILQNAAVLENRLLGDLPANHKAAETAGTSLSVIRHYLDLRKLPAMIRTIRESGDRAAAIVRNMLSFARKSDQRVSSHDLGALLDQTLKLVQTDYDMKKHYDVKQIHIEREYDPLAPPVPCEASKIQQVFMNILKNGAEAMAGAKDAPAPPAFVLRVQDDGDCVRVEIEDNGPGMDEATRRRIFEPFFTTKPVGQGTGLGLSVSYFIVAEDHGGQMSVEAVDGGGTCFVVRLPKGGKGDGETG